MSAPALSVLTFHRVVGARDRGHDLTWASFRNVLEQLAGAPVTTDLGLDSGGRAVVLTFDDGTEDHSGVGEELASMGLRGIFFVSAGKLGLPGYLGEEDLVRLSSLGHVIGSHGFSHVRLGRLGPEALRREVADSRVRLEQVIGQPVTHFAPCAGSRHRLLERSLEQSGYTDSRSMRWGIHRSETERFNVPCVPVLELTVARGWVSETLARGRLPWPMTATYAAKQLIPPTARAAVRRRSMASAA